MKKTIISVGSNSRVMIKRLIKERHSSIIIIQAPPNIFQ